MPPSLSYPGVYIEEIPSGVRTISGVATSITAFIGRAKKGVVNEPHIINCFPDFEREFGGLWEKSYLGFAVRDFFQNGGSQAVIIRLYRSDNAPSKAVIEYDKIKLEAATEGAWGNNLSIRVDHDTKDPAKLFNLTVLDGGTGAREMIRNLSPASSTKRYVGDVLKYESKLIRLREITGLPAKHPDPADCKYPDPFDSKNNPNCHGLVKASGSDGLGLKEADFIGLGTESEKKGLYALEKADIFNLLCIPPYEDNGSDVTQALWDAAVAYCAKRRALLIVDPPRDWKTMEDAALGIKSFRLASKKNAAMYFPRLRQSNPLKGNQMESFVPCGAVAGVFARTDATRGVWKAPAGLEATLSGAPELGISLTDMENKELNPLGLNCLRSMAPARRVVWGARTLDGDDRNASEWKYIPVRRLALFIEESLYRGTQWVVFEPNDEPLWSQIRLNLGAFMHNLFRQGAFQGQSPREAYFVKCDKETTTQNDINLGIVNIVVGFAPLKPAEFVVIKLQQMAGQIQA